jgi:DNA mismatch repair protein MutS
MVVRFLMSAGELRSSVTATQRVVKRRGSGRPGMVRYLRMPGRCFPHRRLVYDPGIPEDVRFAPLPRTGPSIAGTVSQTSSDTAGEQAPAATPRRGKRASPSTKPGTTPMMAQWHEAKAAYPECLLFFRMGDFYELFFDDAVKAATTLDIALTRRGEHGGEPVPMAGVPVHAADQYLPRLIRAGHRVAVCEQMESPAEAKLRGKSLVRRDVVRVITPGTLTEESLLDARRHNYLAALAEAGGALGLAWLDMSTGEVWLQPLAAHGGESVMPAELAAALARIAPGELLVPERLAGRDAFAAVWREFGEALTPLPASRFDSESGRRRLEETWNVAALDAFGDPGRAEIAAAGALIDYVRLTQIDRMPRLARPRRLAAAGSAGAVMEIDPASRRNLELTETLAGERRGSLLSVVDRTVSGPGARLLAARLAAPLTDAAAIRTRLDAVGYGIADARLRADSRERLGACPDIERALSRLSVGRGGPRDLAAVRAGLAVAAELGDRLDCGSIPLPASIAVARGSLGGHEVLVAQLDAALAGELPFHARDGGFIAPGFSAELDEQQALRDQSRKLIVGLQGRYAAATGVASLKIKHNNVLGYFIEVTSAHAEKLRDPARTDEAVSDNGDMPGFIHRQTMANAMRFTTVELSELEDRISGAGERALALELALFDELVAAVLDTAETVAAAARALAEIDVAMAFAELAATQRYCCPEIAEDTSFDIRRGRHPVVEAALAGAAETPFIANDCNLGEADGGDAGGNGRMWLLTGPNMAGKSTFLRQNALIAVLAQAGSYVPAEAARIGIVDRLFSRVGASDDLARGRSTFMVEMVETATILNLSGPQSLVILDEIGRGTATFDGLSIAWATIEHLHERNRCRTLFATHFHELTNLAARLPQLACHTMRVKEWQGDVVFLHEVAAGTADRSYGIHVARLAGLPPPVLARAEEVLALLEKGDQGNALTRLADDLPLFRAAAEAAETYDAEPDALRALLEGLDPDALSPRDALDLLYRLKALADV